jgi:enamine deaminase RidA (YjgF/YER057c/UK114 family)
MTGRIEQRLTQLNITLPAASAPAANYVPWTMSGSLLFVSGQIPMVDGKPGFVGKVGQAIDLETARQAARVVGLNLIAQAKAACDGDLDRVRRCLRLGAFVNCVDGFAQQPEVANGASELMVEVFGDAGRHARFAVGVTALPRGVAVEVDATFEIVV